MNKRQLKCIDWGQLERDLRKLYRQLRKRQELAIRAIGAERRICTQIDLPVVADANDTLHIVRERHRVLTPDEDEEDNVSERQKSTVVLFDTLTEVATLLYNFSQVELHR